MGDALIDGPLRPVAGVVMHQAREVDVRARMGTTVAMARQDVLLAMAVPFRQRMAARLRDGGISVFFCSTKRGR
jgi:hypothetical protein